MNTKTNNDLKQIASFTIDHLKLLPGIYVSRKDQNNETIITTFDIRIARPNYEPVLNNAEIHTIEHLAATFLRSHNTYKDKIVYFGPMGCRTGFYLIMFGDFESKDILPLVTEMFQFISNYEGEIPGSSAVECGNYLDMNLNMAKYIGKRFLDNTLLNITNENLVYPK